jgi:hypothetical protein
MAAMNKQKITAARANGRDLPNFGSRHDRVIVRPPYAESCLISILGFALLSS